VSEIEHFWKKIHEKLNVKNCPAKAGFEGVNHMAYLI